MLASRHFQRRQRAACLTSRTGYPSPPPRWCLNPAIDPKLAACPFPFSSQLRCGSRWTLVEALPASCLACSAAGRRRGRRRAGKDTWSLRNLSSLPLPIARMHVHIPARRRVTWPQSYSLPCCSAARAWGSAGVPAVLFFCLCVAAAASFPLDRRIGILPSGEATPHAFLGLWNTRLEDLLEVFFSGIRRDKNIIN